MAKLIGYGKIYDSTLWGFSSLTEFGAIYYRDALIPTVLANVQSRATYYENVSQTTETLTDLKNCEI